MLRRQKRLSIWQYVVVIHGITGCRAFCAFGKGFGEDSISNTVWTDRRSRESKTGTAGTGAPSGARGETEEEAVTSTEPCNSCRAASHWKDQGKDSFLWGKFACSEPLGLRHYTGRQKPSKTVGLGAIAISSMGIFYFSDEALKGAGGGAAWWWSSSAVSLWLGKGWVPRSVSCQKNAAECPGRAVQADTFIDIGQVNEPGWSTYRQLLERFSVEVRSDARNGSTSLRVQIKHAPSLPPQ